MKEMNCSRPLINSTKDLEAEQQQLWNEELKYARGKETVCLTIPRAALGQNFHFVKVRPNLEELE